MASMIDLVQTTTVDELGWVEGRRERRKSRGGTDEDERAARSVKSTQKRSKASVVDKNTQQTLHD